MMYGHKEYFYVDGLDAAKGELIVTQANADKSFVREKGIVISTDSETKYWKNGEPARFADQSGGTHTHRNARRGQGQGPDVLERLSG